MKIRTIALATSALITMSGYAFAAQQPIDPPKVYDTTSDIKCNSDQSCQATANIIVNKYVYNGGTGIMNLTWHAVGDGLCTGNYYRPSGTATGCFVPAQVNANSIVGGGSPAIPSGQGVIFNAASASPFPYNGPQITVGASGDVASNNNNFGIFVVKTSLNSHGYADYSTHIITTDQADAGYSSFDSYATLNVSTGITANHYRDYQARLNKAGAGNVSTMSNYYASYSDTGTGNTMLLNEFEAHRPSMPNGATMNYFRAFYNDNVDGVASVGSYAYFSYGGRVYIGWNNKEPITAYTVPLEVAGTIRSAQSYTDLIHSAFEDLGDVTPASNITTGAYRGGDIVTTLHLTHSLNDTYAYSARQHTDGSGNITGSAIGVDAGFTHAGSGNINIWTAFRGHAVSKTGGGSLAYNYGVYLDDYSTGGTNDNKPIRIDGGVSYLGNGVGIGAGNTTSACYSTTMRLCLGEMTGTVGLNLSGDSYAPIYFNVTNSNANFRNWALIPNGSGEGTFDVMVSNSQGGNPVYAGASALTFSRTKAATFGSSVTSLSTFQGTGTVLTAAAPTVTASQIGFGSTVVAPGASSCPVTVVTGCFVINVAGTARVVPYY